jgi:predicted transcriptional regulator
MRMKVRSIRIPPDDSKKLEALAKLEGLQASDLIRRAIREFLAKSRK